MKSFPWSQSSGKKYVIIIYILPVLWSHGTETMLTFKERTKTVTVPYIYVHVPEVHEKYCVGLQYLLKSQVP